MRRLRWLVPLVVLLLVGGWWSLEAMTAPERKWLPVERDDLVLGVEVTGTLKAVETSLLGPPQLRQTWQFKIANMAPEGEEVEEGTPVLGFDTSELDQRLQREIAERDAAKKRVEKSEQEAEIARQQSEMQLAEARARFRKASLKAESPEELKAALELQQIRLDLELATKEVAYLERKVDSSTASWGATLAALRAQLDQAERQVKQTEAAIASMSRKAPRAGTVIYVSNWRDEKKKVGDSCWRGEEVIELPDLNRMKAMGQIHEADAGKVVEGQRITLRLDAHPDVEFTGKVASIWRTVQKESWRSPLKVVRLEVELDETDTRRMRPGMRYRGEVETERIDDALLVDVDAVFLEDRGPVVYRKSWLGFERVPVELGGRNEKRIQVLSGLAEGDRISATRLKADAS